MRWEWERHRISFTLKCATYELRTTQSYDRAKVHQELMPNKIGRRGTEHYCGNCIVFACCEKLSKRKKNPNRIKRVEKSEIRRRMIRFGCKSADDLQIALAIRFANGDWAIKYNNDTSGRNDLWTIAISNYVVHVCVCECVCALE